MRRLSPKLDPWLKHYYQLVKAQLEKGVVLTPALAREGLATLTAGLVTESPELPWVHDDRVQGPHGPVPLRVYHPDPGAPLPVLVYCHGGGHMAGGIAVYDPICRKLARESRHIVVSIEYRLAPEHPYPAGVEDARQVVANVWAPLERQGLSHRRILSMAGDSAGGALCATVAHMAQYDPQIHIRRQALIYPSLDYTLSLPSVEENATGYLLETDKIRWYFDHYFQNGEDRRAASPLAMACTSRLPETLVITAEFCPLRDEGAAYVERLKAAGLHAERLHLDHMIHAFLNLEDLVRETCRSVYRRMGEFLNRGASAADA
jgi:acetyl esterase/lipase